MTGVAMINRAMKAASDWLLMGIVFGLLKIPIDLLLHRPILNGLWHDWLVGTTTDRWFMLGLFVAVVVIGWGLLTVIFLLGGWLKAWLKQQDS